MTYAGDVTPQRAWELLSTDERVLLVDCRTEAEWDWVGVPDISSLGKHVVTVEWNTWPDGTVNEHFVDHLKEAGVPIDATVLFICRSGIRSRSAAAAAVAAGWVDSHNVTEGFEGVLDEHGHRGNGGWRAAGLPWVQS